MSVLEVFVEFPSVSMVSVFAFVLVSFWFGCFSFCVVCFVLSLCVCSVLCFYYFVVLCFNLFCVLDLGWAWLNLSYYSRACRGNLVFGANVA